MMKDQLLKAPLYTLNEEHKDIRKKLQTARRQEILHLKHGSEQQFMDNKKKYASKYHQKKKQELRAFPFYLNNLT